MAQQDINLGASANDGTGDPLRTGGQKIQDNFTELYGRSDGNIPHQIIPAAVNWDNLSDTVGEVQLIWAAVNSSPSTIVKHDHQLFFRTLRNVYGQAGSLTTYDIYETYWLLKDKLTVVSGSNVTLGTGQTQLTASNGSMTFAGRKITKIVNGSAREGGFTVDFGATGATPIEDLVSAAGPYDTSLGLYLFKGNDGTDDYLYIYNGSEDEIGTGTGVTLGASDFTILTEATANPAPTNAQTIKLIGDNNVALEAPLAVDFVGAIVTQDPITEHAVINIGLGYVNVEAFGAKGDGVQLNDWSVTGSTLSSPSYAVTLDDVGKTVSIAYAGASGEHLVTKVSSVDTGANTMTLALAATTNVTSKLGSIGTDNIQHLQDAYDYMLNNEIMLFAPPGIYLIGDQKESDSQTVIRISSAEFQTKNKSYGMIGAGKGLTIFRELDGKTQRYGRFTKMFYHYQINHEDVGNIVLRDFTFDKNARSLTKQPPSEFEWEQAHAIQFAGSTDPATAVKFVRSLTVRDVEIYDKIGAGINWSTSLTRLGSSLFENITEQTESYSTIDVDASIVGDWDASTNTPDILSLAPAEGTRYNVTVGGTQASQTFAVKDQIVYTNGGWWRIAPGRLTNKHGVLYGDRAELEISPYGVNNFFKNCTLKSAQIEPTRPASKENPRGSTFDSCNIHFLQYTEPNDTDYRYSTLSVSKCVSSNFLPRNVDFNISKSKIGVPDLITTPYGLIESCTIILPYDSTDNSITPAVFAYLGTYDTDNYIKIKSSKVEIDSDDPDIRPTGYAIDGANCTPEQSTVILEDVIFDKRLKSSVNTYSNGRFEIRNCRLSGDTDVIITGGFSIYACYLVLENNNYDQVDSGSTLLRLVDNNTLWFLDNREVIDSSQWRFTSSGSVGDRSIQILNHVTIKIDAIANRGFVIIEGNKFEIKNPTAGNYRKYLCTVGGTGVGSTVKGYELIET